MKFYPIRTQTNQTLDRQYPVVDADSGTLNTQGANLHSPLVSSNAAQFTAANSEYLSRTSEAALNIGGHTAFTFACWIMADNLASYGIISKALDTDPANRQFDILVISSKVRFEVSDGTSFGLIDSNVISSDTNYFVVGWHDPDTDTVNIQINNGTSLNNSWTTGVNSSEFNLYVGQFPIWNFYNGRVSRCGFWKRLLTSAEKTYLYNKGVGLPYSQLGITGTAGSALKTSLVEYWDLDETSGTRAGSHAGLDLTDNNTVTSAYSPRPYLLINQADGNDTLNVQLTVKLYGPVAPSTTANHQVRLTGTVTGTNKNVPMLVELRQGSTLIMESEFVQSATTIDSTIVLTAGEVALITDYSDLYLTLRVHDHSSIQISQILIDEFYLEDTDFYPNDLTNLAAWYRSDVGVITDAVAQFTATNSEYLSRTSEAALQTGDIDFTWAGWVKVPDFSIDNAILSKGNSLAAGGEFEAYAAITTGNIVFIVRKADDSGQVILSSSTTITANTWTFIELYHDSINNVIGVKINNGTATTQPITTGVFIGSNVLWIGRGPTPGLSNASIGRFGFWKRLITDSERTFLYNSGSGRFYSELGKQESPDGHNLKTSLVEYWNLCEASGTRVGSHASLDLTDNNTVTFAQGPGEGPAQNNTPVKRWEDQSGNGRHVIQSDITKQPLYIANVQNGKPIVRADGVDNRLVYTTDTGCTVAASIMTISKTASTDARVVFGVGQQSGGTLLSHYINTNHIAAGGSVPTDTDSGIAASTVSFAQFTTTYDGVTVRTFVNAVEGTSASRTLTTSGEISMFSSFTPSQYLNGDIGEVILYKNALSDGNRGSSETYLNTRYAVY